MSIIPDKLPEQSLRALEQILADQRINRDKDKVCLVGIRGFFRDSMGVPGQNDIAMYDDAFFLVAPGRVIAFNANTDPSAGKAGIAVLIPGVHRYTRGLHGISRGPGYPAFIPNTPGKKLPVRRNGQTKVSIGVAINIHRGGNNVTSSAGCQTVPPAQWQRFYDGVDYLMTTYNQDDFPYVLIEKPNL